MAASIVVYLILRVNGLLRGLRSVGVYLRERSAELPEHTVGRRTEPGELLVRVHSVKFLGLVVTQNAENQGDRR